MASPARIPEGKQKDTPRDDDDDLLLAGSNKFAELKRPGSERHEEAQSGKG